ncbi:MAG: flagellar motor switch phosphatase FliY [Halanaerobiaceae bacterium]
MSDDDFLSQEEIDALMNDENDETNDTDSGSSQNDLSDDEKDVLGEFGNIAMGSAATALYSLLDQRVEITAPEVEVIEFGVLAEEYQRPCVMVQVEYLEGLEGMNLLIIDDRDAKIIGDLMMGGDGTDPADDLDEIHLSAIGEAMNQMMGSASTAMSSIVDGMVNISPPELEYLKIDDVIEDEEKLFQDGEKVVSISFQLKIGDLIDSSFKQIAPLDFTHKLVEQLSGNASGLTAKEAGVEEEQIEEEQVAEETQSQTQQKPEQQEPVSQKSQQSVAQEAASGQGAAVGQKQAAAQASSRNVSKKRSEQREVDVKTAQFPDFDKNTVETLPQNMELIKDVPLQVTVRLGKAKMTIREILELGEGSIIELDKLAGEPVDLLINGKLVAKGEVVVIDENFGFRVKDIIKPMERLNNIQ